MNHSKLFLSLILFITVVSCSSAPTDSPTESPTSRPRTTATPEVFSERLGHVKIVDRDTLADYLYRSFLQIPVGMAWGPNGLLYVADWTGRHVVRVAKDGQVDDLPFWKTVASLQRDGPRGIAFDSIGNLYISNHNSIWRIGSDGTMSKLTGVNGSPIGSIAIGPSDVLYYTDRAQNGGSIKRWENGKSTRVVQDLPNAESLVFGQDGTLYVTQLWQKQVLKVDLKSLSTSPFVTVDACAMDPCFLAVDHEGDIWVRGINSLDQFTTDGVEKTFMVDEETYPGGSFGWHSGAGIAFDDEGGLWVASYNSRLVRLAPVTPGESDPKFTLQLVVPGFEASDLEAGPDGEVYAGDENNSQILLIHPDKSVDVLLKYDQRGRVGLAVDSTNTVYAGMPNGEIVRINGDGSATHYASLLTRRMAFGADGALYAIVGDFGQNKSIVRITNVDTYTTVTTQIAGVDLGSGEAHISPALDKGFYIYIEQSCDLLFMDYSGQGHLIKNIRDLVCSGGPAIMTASPVTGNIFLIVHGPYILYSISPDGQVKSIAKDVYGDPWGMTVSRDGQWVYVAESGAIDKIPLSEGNP
ncbi:MAG TPA: hypothetical protein PKL78_09030 [Anaerolineales bacterium]|nr:hypothetical protein [Anaerolineales bacterium]